MALALLAPRFVSAQTESDEQQEVHATHKHKRHHKRHKRHEAVHDQNGRDIERGDHGTPAPAREGDLQAKGSLRPAGSPGGDQKKLQALEDKHAAAKKALEAKEQAAIRFVQTDGTLSEASRKAELESVRKYFQKQREELDVQLRKEKSDLEVGGRSDNDVLDSTGRKSDSSVKGVKSTSGDSESSGKESAPTGPASATTVKGDQAASVDAKPAAAHPADASQPFPTPANCASFDISMAWMCNNADQVTNSMESCEQSIPPNGNLAACNCAGYKLCQRCPKDEYFDFKTNQCESYSKCKPGKVRVGGRCVKACPDGSSPDAQGMCALEGLTIIPPRGPIYAGGPAVIFKAELKPKNHRKARLVWSVTENPAVAAAARREEGGTLRPAAPLSSAAQAATGFARVVPSPRDPAIAWLTPGPVPGQGTLTVSDKVSGKSDPVIVTIVPRKHGGTKCRKPFQINVYPQDVTLPTGGFVKPLLAKPLFEKEPRGAAPCPVDLYWTLEEHPDVPGSSIGQIVPRTGKRVGFQSGLSAGTGKIVVEDKKSAIEGVAPVAVYRPAK